ncbi:SRPBCC family protein [Demequina iriomotensis]|uniref:SRPBCC family protein n=1 Tax=Demequina iriomotensis TaxID=1536641 RepID=UPI000785B104|nr:SRPBCC domain-containing protein [Demequina iriomotensis]
MTGITDEGIEIDRDFAAPPEAVFDAWVTRESFARWFGGKEVDVPLDELDYRAEAGRAWSALMVLPNGHAIAWAGEFLEVERPTRLVMTLTDRPEEAARARLVITLEPSAAGTRMRMTQETPGFTTEQREGVLAGWQTFIDVIAEILG